MIAWLLYVTAVGVVVSLASALAEAGLRSLGRPVRWVWVAAMLGTVGLPVVATVGGDGATGSWSTVPSVGGRLILLAWIAGAAMLLANLRLADWTLRRNARSWRPAEQDGRRVLMTAGFGPGVVGARRPRIVLPEWVLAEDRSLVRLIVTHEVEHVRAGDTRLLLAGSVLVALLPWCLPLWWQQHRLRGAIETDCDARVLNRAVPPRDYANALVAIAGRPVRSRRPLPALAPRESELERRIKQITDSGQVRSRKAGALLLAAAAVGTIGVAAVPVAPPPRALAFDIAVPERRAEVAPTDVRVILSIQPEVVEPAPR
jgi:bla regulator protein BlaR1